jgi:hypothetical protein
VKRVVDERLLRTRGVLYIVVGDVQKEVSTLAGVPPYASLTHSTELAPKSTACHSRLMTLTSRTSNTSDWIPST